jgi:hypothetical protein
MATEVVYIPLKEGLDIGSGDDKALLESTLSTIGKQKGLKSLYWGLQIEDQNVLQMCIGMLFMFMLLYPCSGAG